MVLQVDPSRPTVVLPQHGKVIGVLHPAEQPLRPSSVEAFYGIPYCLPPTGDRRFRPAQPVPASPDNVLDASKYGPAAPGKQLLAGGPPLVYSEDCLTANVFRQPAAAHEEGRLLPVAIYIHGGAFNRGTASMHNTASMLAHAEDNFVAVTFNYRIGALGFLPSALSAEEGVLNLGLQDQIVLFEWVQENIRAFGGDPHNVTLFGLSAGAHSIGHHLLHYSPDTKPLFNRVIIESGSPTSRAVRPFNAPVHEAQFNDFLAAAGVPSSLAPSEVFPFLRAQPTEVIQAAQTTVFDKYNPSLQWAFQPVIDGAVIPRPPLDSWRQGKWHKVPIMTGFQRNEGSLYVDKKMSASDEFTGFFRTLLPLLSDEDVQRIDELYPDPATTADSPYRETREGVGAQYMRIERAYGHYAYVAPVRQTAEYASGGPGGVPVPVYVYQWAQLSSVLNGAQHGINMRYEACEPSIIGVSENQSTLAKTLHAYVTSFITQRGDPNAGAKAVQRPVWGAYHALGKDKPMAMVFGLGNEELIGGALGEAATFTEDSWGRDECEFWWTKVDLSQQ
ncbi:Alpha/Beta hydrolase protein [Coniella lustricola]|uniref:Carboxylic ester hydrolase n=1 Tax=Coniella lustricola TaxID=2025994 RepID=A0A2T3A7C2_9PEZI|nr:Alpha/Beta hydrolase protein [Coniella lustricola]